MNSKKNDLIKLLEFINRAGTKGVIIDEINEKFKDNQYIISQFKMMQGSTYSNWILRNGPHIQSPFILTPLGYSKLVDYWQMLSAQKTSKMAIFIALISVITSLFTTIWQILK